MKKFRLIFGAAMLAFLGLNSSAVAQNIINLTWMVEEYGSLEQQIFVIAPNGTTFTVDWGNGTTNHTGTGNEQKLSRTYTLPDNYEVYDVSITGNIIYLRCSGTLTTALDVSQNKVLQTLWCNNNGLTALNVGGATALTELSCSNNFLFTSLNVSQNTALQTLYCSSNKSLTALNVSQNTALQSLHCDRNSLKSLDVSKNTALIKLDCSDNKITVLNVGETTTLTELNCSDNEITALNVGGATALTELNCAYNPITDLDVSKNTALEYLYCADNGLTALDVSGATALTELLCNSNFITDLDVSKNTALEYLYCDNNFITTITLSSSAPFSWGIGCDWNRLHLSELYELSERLKNVEGDVNLGSQFLPPMTVKINEEQFADQSAFGGKFTEYVITPNSGFTVTNGKLTFTTLGTYEVKMTNPAILSGVNFPAEVNITIKVTETGVVTYPVTVIDGSGSGDYEEGETVTITSNTAPTGYHFKEWNITPNVTFTDGTNTTSPTAKFTMPAQPVTATAIFEESEDITETPMMAFPQIYPNPTYSELKIPNYEGGEIQIYDLMGRTLMSLKTLPSPETTIDVSHLPSGIYFLKIGNKTVKFVKE